MKQSEHTHPSRSCRDGKMRKGNLFAALALTATALATPGAAFADTVLTFDLNSSTSDLAGNPTISPTAFCITTSPCPSTPTYALGANVPMSGTISIDTTKSTMTFDLTLTQNASFSNGLTIDSGSSFVASTPINVSITSKGKVDTILPGTGTFTALGALNLSSGFTQSEGQGIVSSIDCSITVGIGGSCGFLIGTPVAGTDALQIMNGATPYNGVMSISANLVEPVPLPSALWLLASGASGLFLIRRRVRQ